MKMLESSALRYCLYGCGFIISSEIIYHSYFWYKKKLKELSSSPEVCEIIWTNELSQCCIGRSNSHNGKSNGAGSSPSRFAKIIAPLKSTTQCKNQFCCAKNIQRLIEFIDSAKYSIDLAMYTFTSFELSQALLRAFNRGVLIRVVSDHEMAYSSGSQIIPLTKSGVPIRCNTNSSFMHHKFCLLDSPQRVTEILKKRSQKPNKTQVNSMLLTGSLNWTNQGLNVNWENILITNNMYFVHQYSEEFERMWRAFDIDL